MRAVIYTRVSTQEQTTNLSLPTQMAACESWCRQNGYTVAGRFVEQGESAKTADRPKLKELLSFCRENKGNIAVVVVYNITRFARDRVDHAVLRMTLKNVGTTLRSATEAIDDSSSGQLMENVLSAFAQFDNNVKADRTKAGMK